MTSKTVWTAQDYNNELDSIARTIARLEKALAENKAQSEPYCPHCQGTLHQDRNGYQVCPWCAASMTWDEHEAGGVIAEVCDFVEEIATPVKLVDCTDMGQREFMLTLDAMMAEEAQAQQAVAYDEVAMVKALCKVYSQREMRETLRRLNIPGRSACSSKQDMAVLLMAAGANL